jgi:prepilin-type N-terminal cleavage/methylation domain-containing protein
VKWERAANRVRGDDGFTVIEMLLAMALFLVISSPLMAVVMASAATQRVSRERTLAQQQAMATIEQVRALPYDSVGTVAGNPPGLIQASRTFVAGGLVAAVNTQVTYVADRVPTAYDTGADYKKVTVTVVRQRDSRVLTREVTYVAPPGSAQYSGMTNAIVRATVLDYALATPVVGATVTLGTGPSATRNDITDAAGLTTFPALTPNPTTGAQAYYDLSVTAPGYQTLKDDLSPSTAAHVQLAPGQTFSTSLRVYKPSTITVNVRDAAGAPYTQPATVTIGSPRAVQSFTVTTGSLSVTQLGGEYIVPGLRYSVAASTSTGLFSGTAATTVPNNYPTDLTSSFTVGLGATPYTTRSVTWRVVNSGGAAVPGARVEVTGGPAATYLGGTTDASGNLTLAIPVGSGYTVTAKSAALTGTWTGSITTTTPTTTITVR